MAATVAILIGRASLIALISLLGIQNLALGSSSPPSTDVEAECQEADQDVLLPRNASVAGVTDDGRTVVLETLVLLDSVGKQRAIEVMDVVAAAYAPLEIDVHRRFRRLSIPSSGEGPTGVPAADGQVAIDGAKAALGGSRPVGTDAVLLLTNKDLYSDGGFGMFGRADCIGGVRYPHRAFAVAEVDPAGFPEPGPLSGDIGAVGAAHELGHLLGAIHEHGNCAEGTPTAATDGRPTPCTVMDSLAAGLNAARFGAFESAVIRGHAVDFATP